MMKKSKCKVPRPLVGKIFEELFVQSYDSIRDEYLCKCFCGRMLYVSYSDLTLGRVRSCSHRMY